MLAEALGYDTADDPTLDGLDVDLDDETVRREAGVEACAAAERLRWLPCLVRPDLGATIGMDIAAGLIENDLRTAITGGQRARAAEQLSMAEGWNVTRIAAATGLSRAHARAAAALPHLGERARQATYRGELSLEHVAVLDTLAAEGATDDELGSLARSGAMFEHHVAELTKTLRRRGAADALRDEVDTRHWTLYEEPEGYPLDSPLAPLWSLSRAEDLDGDPLLPRHGPEADPTGDRSAATYALLPGHGVVLIHDPWEEPRLEVVCADPETQGYQRDRRSTLYVAPAAHAEPGDEPEPEADIENSTPADGDGHPATDVDAGDDPDPAGQDDQAAAAARVATERARADADEREERRRVEVAQREEQRRVEAAERAAENERIEAEHAAARARRDALDTAADTRWSHTAAMLRSQKAAVGHVELATVLYARFPWLLTDVDYFADGVDVAAVCAEPERDARTGAQRWSPGRITHRAVVVAARLLHNNLTQAAVVAAPMLELTDAEPAVWWLDYLTSRGYQPAEVETQARGLLEKIVTAGLAAEYGTDPEPESGDGADDQDRPDGDGDGGAAPEGEQV